jgi:DNA-binding NarL/FixJ family response regulator
MKTPLVIFEDNESLREFLVTLLNSSEEFEVLADLPNVLQAKEVIERYKPDLVILDIDMPEKDGISVIPIIKECHPTVLIVMYTQFQDEDKIFRSLSAGADGYILKKLLPVTLFSALKEVMNGGAPMSPMIARKVLDSFQGKIRGNAKKYHLTSRETEVLKLLVKGCSMKFIASELSISFETCKSHLKNIYLKLQVNCGREAIAKVLAERINFEE